MKKAFISIILLILFANIISILFVDRREKKFIEEITKNDNFINIDINKNKGIKEKYSKEDLYIDVYITKDKKIDRMNIEDYVIGVISAEMPAEFEIEALKAQAVAARTYGLSHKENFGGGRNPKALGADVNDTTDFQAFMYKEERMSLWPKKNRDKYWEKIIKAVKETEGEILIYKEELVMAPYYFSTSSGKTEDAIDVFSKSQPYLKSVESPGEEKAPKYTTENRYSYRELATILNNWDSKLNLKTESLSKQISILERSKGGSVTKIKIGKEYITGQKFRSLLGLNSSNFTIKFDGMNVTITSKGYGHGVGMSQWGANAMAKKGYTYKRILEHYYQGIEVLKLAYK